jgi:hypothetical protein
MGFNPITLALLFPVFLIVPSDVGRRSEARGINCEVCFKSVRTLIRGLCYKVFAVHRILYTDFEFYARYNDRRLTIFTSNYQDERSVRESETLEDRIGVRLRSRLYQMCQTILIDGEDYRRRFDSQ